MYFLLLLFLLNEPYIYKLVNRIFKSSGLISIKNDGSPDMVRVYELKNWAFSLKGKMSWKLKEGG